MQDLKIYRDADFRWYETLPGKSIHRLKENEQHQTPADIIGRGSILGLIKKHLKAFPEKENKFADRDLKIIASTYEALRRHGWYDPGFDEHGRVCFGSPYQLVL